MKLGDAANLRTGVRACATAALCFLLTACAAQRPTFEDLRVPHMVSPTGGSDIDPTHVDAPQLLALRQLDGNPLADEALPHAPPGIDEDYSQRKKPGAGMPALRGTQMPEGPDAETAMLEPRGEIDIAALKPADPPAKPKTEAKGKKIRAVAVPSVKGAPGRGNSELTAAMRKVLKDAGWPVRSSPSADSLTVRGKVKVGQGKNGQQKVVLAWQVIDPSGQVLGTIRQANQVPQGAIDKGFGQNANFAAQGAASGIFDLIDRVKRRQG
ncbi:MAG: hypothetical protein ACR2OJ_02125 [Hyphomicrobiales bacterium]